MSAALRQWCRRCQTAGPSLPCTNCDGLVCAVCAADPGEELGDLCDQCAALAVAEMEEG